MKLNSADRDRVVEGTFAPAGVEDVLGPRRGDLGGVGGERADVAQEGPHRLIDVRGLEVDQECGEEALVDAECLCGGLVDAVAVVAGVQPGDVGRDELALRLAERGLVAHQGLVVVDERPCRVRVGAEHVEQLGVLGQRGQVGHAAP
jgi:hypothetical protein